MREEPLIGFGYYAASRVLAPQHNPNLGNAHSVFFEFLVGGGLIGAALYLVLCTAMIVYAARLALSAAGDPEAIATVGLFAFTLILGITSTEAVLAGPVGFVFWSMTALLPAMCRQHVGRASRAPFPAFDAGCRPWCANRSRLHTSNRSTARQ
jgi:O-antigen ligase